MSLILNLIFPPKCGFCGKIEDINSEKFICNQCLNKLEVFRLKNKIDDEVYSIYEYKSIIRNAILDYKFRDKSYLYKTFKTCILFDKKVCNFIKSYDIISPVPLYYSRFLERGYNQTALICKELSKYTDIAYLATLDKVKNIKPQPTKDLVHRLNDVKGVYKLKNSVDISEKKVLIFDDVLTTGATTRECKKELLKGGAKNVGILTLARGIDNKEIKGEYNEQNYR